MRAMFKEVLNSGDLAMGPSLAVVIFTLFMLAVFAWIYRPRSRVAYQQASRMALEEGE